MPTRGSELNAVLAHLERSPDVVADNLYAVDGTDRILLEHIEARLSDLDTSRTVVIFDQYGALTLGMSAVLGVGGIRVHQDPISHEYALARNAARLQITPHWTSHGLDEELLARATLVVARIPRSVEATRWLACMIARYAGPHVTLIAAGRQKYVTRSHVDALTQTFDSVQGTLAHYKSRAYVCTGASEQSDALTPPAGDDADSGLSLRAIPGTFAGANVDIGTRFLLSFLGQMKPDAQRIVDLGCGNGVCAAAAAITWPHAQVIATDQSWAATQSARLTAAANGLEDRVTIIRDDAASTLEAASCDLVLCNPPFHVGAAVHIGAATKLIGEAARILRTGGELWTVYNSHLRYRSTLSTQVGHTEQMGRNPKFTVTVSRTR